MIDPTTKVHYVHYGQEHGYTLYVGNFLVNFDKPIENIWHDDRFVYVENRDARLMKKYL
jgi:hypothetical protein